MGFSNNLVYAASFAALLLSTPTSATIEAVQFDSDSIDTGEQVQAACKTDVIGCINFVSGIIGAVETMQSFYEQKPLFCLPTNLTNALLWSTVGKAYDRFPTLKKQRAAESVIMLLIVEFPCPANKV